VKKLASLVLAATFVSALAGCPDSIDEGRSMMKGASKMEKDNVEGQVKQE
jgi:hypothetical protein